MLQCSIFCKDYHVLDYSKTLKSFAQAWMEESLKGIFITGTFFESSKSPFKVGSHISPPPLSFIFGYFFLFKINVILDFR